MKKRLVSLLLVGVMAAGMLAGCGGSDGQDSKGKEEGGESSGEVAISFYTGISPTFIFANVNSPAAYILAGRLPNAASLSINANATQPTALIFFPSRGPPFQR